MQNAQNEIMVFVIRQLQIPFHETAILTIYISPQKFGKQTFKRAFLFTLCRGSVSFQRIVLGTATFICISNPCLKCIVPIPKTESQKS